MTNSMTKSQDFVIKQIFEKASETIGAIINHVSVVNKTIENEQKTIWLESLNLKKGQLNNLYASYKGKILSKEEENIFNHQVEEIINSCLEINNEYDQKIEKRHDENVTILKLCIRSLLALGVTGIIGYSSVQISNNIVKKS